jgi:hypothetical protein
VARTLPPRPAPLAPLTQGPRACTPPPPQYASKAARTPSSSRHRGPAPSRVPGASRNAAGRHYSEPSHRAG